MGQSLVAGRDADSKPHCECVLDCTARISAAREFVSAEQAANSASRGARAAKNRVHKQVRQGLGSVSAIATTAPLVGLVGTAIGILDSFRGYVGNKHAHIAFLAANLAEVLVPTAAGLLVGVLATWCFNWRSERLSVFDTEMEIASIQVVNYLEKQSRAGKL